MAIELRYKVIAGRVNFEFERLCDLTVKVRKAKAARELELANSRYMEYCADDDSLSLDMGALMIRESNYCQADGAFDQTFQPFHSDRLAAMRRSIDEELLELLRKADWNEARLEALRGVLEDRMHIEANRREELLAYAERFRNLNPEIQAHVNRGHYAEACRALTEILERVQADCAKLEAIINEPATGP